MAIVNIELGTPLNIRIKALAIYVIGVYHVNHSDYRTVSPYWVLPVYVELIRAVWADDRDRPLLF
jgi:hypothetical protein